MGQGIGRNSRGVALIVVLLITALLMALVIEFAADTRTSLHAAVNFRDSQRAYYLARSGVNFAGLLLADNVKNNKLQDNIEQLDWQVVPLQAASDTELKVRWTDEGGRISIGTVFKANDAYNRLARLFDLRGISQDRLDRIAEDRKSFQLLTELHEYLKDEEYAAIAEDVTVSQIAKINVNTAPAEVLQSLGLSAGMASMVVERRKQEPFTKIEDVNAYLGPDNTLIAGMLDVTSNVFKVQSYATVGGYTKQVEAVITRSPTGVAVNYWRTI